MLQKVRVDKWLWSVRIFKSRTMATDACKSGKVKVNGTNVKPSYLLQREELVDVKKNGFDLQFKVIDLLQKRVGAPIAQKCYEDLTPQEELDKYKDWFVGKGASEKREKGAGRPTKRERREIDGYKGDQYDYSNWEEW
ncbi:MAG: RNA-binding S4 domain-containing protein [Saprospiraceae bacterium]|jgi:ribosome-associated heat shock protein Hsp15|nr:RNA-binding S4 domain-containing protein [Saprospiraceae bacterium]